MVIAVFFAKLKKVIFGFLFSLTMFFPLSYNQYELLKDVI